MTTSTIKDKILIVDDDINNLQVLFQTLQDAGYEILVAKDAATACTRLQHTTPDLILLDVIMPGMDGFAFYRQMRDTLKSHVPVIFLSALTDVNAIVTGLKLSAVDYITKPFDPRVVIARVEKHLQLERLRRELAENNRRLQTEIDELDAFAHTVAHDLKNPLTYIIGFSEILKEELNAHSSPKTEQSLEMILNSSQKMAKIIDDLLLLAQIHRHTITPEPLNMNLIVHEALNHLMPNIERQQAKINLPDDWPQVMGHAPWVEMVWVHYLSNGLKYGGSPPELTLASAVLENGHVRFCVKDNGHGLTDEEQKRLFVEFVRLGRTSKVQGHGLGLSIVQRIVTQLGGEVGVTSAIGTGSSFYFTLPLATELPAQ
ncbi:MAG: hybrid sensor histidine kinase/response regulator [Anaerolineales bacterium]|nr:hybrid sensor histidine kinase/response regulator [Anaerolineales bacterium]